MIEKKLTFIAIQTIKGLHHDVGAATRNMHEWAFFSKPQSRRNGKTLVSSLLLVRLTKYVSAVDIPGQET